MSIGAADVTQVYVTEAVKVENFRDAKGNGGQGNRRLRSFSITIRRRYALLSLGSFEVVLQLTDSTAIGAFMTINEEKLPPIIPSGV